MQVDKLTRAEDLKDWIVRNNEEIQESISKSIIKYCKDMNFKTGRDFNIKKVVDRNELVLAVYDNLIEGLFNVIDTYDEEEVSRKEFAVTEDMYVHLMKQARELGAAKLSIKASFYEYEDFDIVYGVYLKGEE